LGSTSAGLFVRTPATKLILLRRIAGKSMHGYMKAVEINEKYKASTDEEIQASIAHSNMC
jgi:hypothetical protein